MGDVRENAVTLGEVAYRAYGDDRGWVTHGGGVMPAWEDQLPELRHAWEAAARDAVAMAGSVVDAVFGHSGKASREGV